MDLVISVVAFIYAVLVGSVSAVIGVVACTGQACIEYLIACQQVHFTQPEGLPARRHVATAPPESDPARLSYFYGPARSDLRYVRQVARSRWAAAAEWWQDAVGNLWDPSDSSRKLTGPIAAGLAVGLLVALPFAALLAGAIWLTHEVLVDIATISVRCTATILQAADRGLLFTRHIQVRCVACFERIPYPAYLCANPECKRIHWDIRPGRHGVLRRTCECGKQMPTLLLLGTARRLEAICPGRACRHPLEYRPGEVQEIILPIFGSKGAGKTLLLYGIIKTLQQLARPGIQVDYADSDTVARLRDLDAVVTGDSPTPAVPATPAVLPTAYVLRLRIGRRRRIVQLLDTAGELFYDSSRSKDLIYLGAASTFVLVIDPLSVHAFWSGLSSAQRDELAAHRSVAPHPELAYQQTSDRITEMGKPRGPRRLAVVFSRADLLTPDLAPGAGEGEKIRKWATDDLGLGALLRAAEADFRELAFFHTAVFGSDENSLIPLIHWLMRAEGITPQD